MEVVFTQVYGSRCQSFKCGGHAAFRHIVLLSASEIPNTFLLSVSLLPVPESSQLSLPLSASQLDQANVGLSPECCSQLYAESLDGEGERPVSLVSTLSSDSSRDSRSLFGSTVTLPSSTTTPTQSEEDIDLELSPAEGAGERAGSRGRWQERKDTGGIINHLNSNAATSNRKASGEAHYSPASPVITDTMAPNPKLTYVDRVVMEIIETERMYVKDLRSIVEVRGSMINMDFLLEAAFFHIHCEPTI